MTSMHVIVGAGPIGSALAQRLVAGGDPVTVLTRSGTSVPGVEARAVDASDAEALTAAVHGADVLYTCASPGSYSQRAKAWPPLAAAMLTAAERTGTVLVTLSDLYVYGPDSGPITRATPPSPS